MMEPKDMLATLAMNLETLGRYWGDREHMRDYCKGAMRLASNIYMTIGPAIFSYDCDIWAIECIEKGAGSRLEWLRATIIGEPPVKVEA